MVESHTFPRVIEVGGVINYSNNTCKNGQFVILEINCNIQYLKYNLQFRKGVTLPYVQQGKHF